MRTFAVISQKGGAGKSTLACHFAALAGEGGRSVLFDRDPQGTSSKWWNRRQDIEGVSEAPELIDLGTSSLTSAVSGFKAKPGALFIDTRPAVAEPEAEAVRCADAVIVPVRPTMNDLEAVKATLDIIKRIGRPTFIVVNAARNVARAKDARAALSQYGVPVCPTHIADRTIFHDAATEGLTVMEMRGSAAESAAGEVRAAWAWIEATLKAEGKEA